MTVLALLAAIGAKADPLYDEPLAPSAACLGWFWNYLPGQPSDCLRTCHYAFKKYYHKFRKCRRNHRLLHNLHEPEHEHLVLASNFQNNVCKVFQRGAHQKYSVQYYGNNISNPPPSNPALRTQCYPWVQFKHFQCLCVYGRDRYVKQSIGIPGTPVPDNGCPGSADQLNADADIGEVLSAAAADCPENSNENIPESSGKNVNGIRPGGH